MWIFPAWLGILIPGGLRPIAPCLLPAPRRRAVIVILRPGSRGSDCWSFRFSHSPILTIGSTAGLLVGCSRGQFDQQC